MTGRHAAFKALGACRKSGAWPETFLANLIEKEKLDKREAALAGKITFGVLQNTTLLDFYINQYSKTPASKLEPKVLDVLRLTAYQIVFLTRVPARAAVDEGVKLCKEQASKSASGLVNAVLRRISENADNLPEPENEDKAEFLSIKYSHPKWLTEKFISILGFDGASKLLECNNSEIPITAQVNTLKTSTQELLNELEEGGFQANAHPWLADCVELTRTGDIGKIRAFKNGWMYIQDAAAKLAIMAASPQKGDKVIDACAAPGGKTFASAIAMENEGEIVSCDIHEKKLNQIILGAKKLGIDIIKVRAADSREFISDFSEKFDIVIADVPCSGMGVIRKKPEIRQKKASDIKSLPEIQIDILRNVSKYVKPGGILLYTTCTVFKEENEDVL